MEVGWVGYMLLGITKIAFLENPVSCISFLSIINTCSCNILVVILDILCEM